MSNPRQSFDDHYSQLAQKTGKRARSYFKLEEISKKFDLFKQKSGMKVLDLGCAPGSWSQFVLEKTKQIQLVGIDLKPTLPFPPSIIKNNQHQAQFIEGDIRQLDELLTKEGFLKNSFDLILSDMAPNTSGNPENDSYLSYELVLEVMKIAEKWMKNQGFWVAKYFEGAESQELKQEIRERGFQVKIAKPKATRKNSVEIFLICKKSQ